MAKYEITLRLRHIDAYEMPTEEELREYAQNMVNEWTKYNPNEAGWDRAFVKVSARKAEGFDPSRDTIMEVTAKAECKENEWHTSHDGKEK